MLEEFGFYQPSQHVGFWVLVFGFLVVGLALVGVCLGVDPPVWMDVETANPIQSNRLPESVAVAVEGRKGTLDGNMIACIFFFFFFFFSFSFSTGAFSLF